MQSSFQFSLFIVSLKARLHFAVVFKRRRFHIWQTTVSGFQKCFNSISSSFAYSFLDFVSTLTSQKFPVNSTQKLISLFFLFRPLPSLLFRRLFVSLQSSSLFFQLLFPPFLSVNPFLVLCGRNDFPAFNVRANVIFSKTIFGHRLLFFSFSKQKKTKKKSFKIPIKIKEVEKIFSGTLNAYTRRVCSNNEGPCLYLSVPCILNFRSRKIPVQWLMRTPLSAPANANRHAFVFSILNSFDTGYLQGFFS